MVIRRIEHKGFTLIEMLVTFAVMSALIAVVFLGQKEFSSFSGVRVRADDILSTLLLAQSFATSTLSDREDVSQVPAYAVRLISTSIGDKLKLNSYQIQKKYIPINGINGLEYNDFNGAETVYGPFSVIEHIKLTPCILRASEQAQEGHDAVSGCDLDNTSVDGVDGDFSQVLVVFVFPFREPITFLFPRDGSGTIPSSKADWDNDESLRRALGIRLYLDADAVAQVIDIFRTGALSLKTSQI